MNWLVDKLHNFFWEVRRRLWNMKHGQPRVNGVDLYVDDTRTCYLKGYYHAKTAEEAWDILSSQTVVNASFDHDLGDSKRWTGYDLVLCLARYKEEFGLNYWPKNKPVIHSANPVGCVNMESVIERYGPYTRTNHLRSVK